MFGGGFKMMLARFCVATTTNLLSSRLLIIFPTVLITYLSFGVFFMSHEAGAALD